MTIPSTQTPPVRTRPGCHPSTPTTPVPRSRPTFPLLHQRTGRKRHPTRPVGRTCLKIQLTQAVAAPRRRNFVKRNRLRSCNWPAPNRPGYSLAERETTRRRQGDPSRQFSSSGNSTEVYGGPSRLARPASVGFYRRSPQPG